MKESPNYKKFDDRYLKEQGENHYPSYIGVGQLDCYVKPKNETAIRLFDRGVELHRKQMAQQGN